MKKSPGRPKKNKETEISVPVIEENEQVNDIKIENVKFYTGDNIPTIEEIYKSEDGYQIYTTPHGGEEKIPYSLIERMKRKKEIDGFVKISDLMTMYKTEIAKVFSDGQAENYLDAVKVVLNEK